MRPSRDASFPVSPDHIRASCHLTLTALTACSLASRRIGNDGGGLDAVPDIRQAGEPAHVQLHCAEQVAGLAEPGQDRRTTRPVQQAW
jgi:hypothetical protein